MELSIARNYAAGTIRWLCIEVELCVVRQKSIKRHIAIETSTVIITRSGDLCELRQRWIGSRLLG